VLNYLKILYDVFLGVESDKGNIEKFYAGVKAQKCILPIIRNLLKIENLLYFFLGLTNFSENFVYYVFLVLNTIQTFIRSF